MKNNIIKYAACAAMALGVAATAHANLITGSVTFNGTVTLNGASAGSPTTTAVTAWHETANTGSPYVASRGGDFATYLVNGQSVTFAAPWSFVSGPISPFWSVGNFTFDLVASHIVFQGGGGVLVAGTGTISNPIDGGGFTTTPGTWSFSTQDPSAGSPAVFSFSASSGALPDGGMTVMLLGTALSGLALIRRKLA